MGQSLVQIYFHIVFSTKHRKPFLSDENVRKRLFAYLSGICKNLKSPAVSIGGVEDHAHLLCRLGKTIDVSTFIRELKKESSAWVKTDLGISEFYWQSGYGEFSISPGHVEQLKSYILNQEQHHKTETFQEEFRRLCDKYGIEIDERYVWD